MKFPGDMTPKELSAEIRTTADRLSDLQNRLAMIQRTCKHQWGEVKYVPDIQEAYTIPGDPPGTMGVDWRGPTSVPRSEKKRWQRTCAVCDKTETTYRTTTQYVAGAVAGTGGMIDVPCFTESHWTDKALLDDRRY